MGRNENGFAFFRLDTDFFADKKIKSLRRHYGPVGLSTYIYLLSFIYGHEEGYYMKYSSIEDLSWDIAEAIAREGPGKVARCVAECIGYLSTIDLIDKACFERGIITGVSIQGQYIAMCKACRRPIKLTKYRLIDDEDYLVMRKNTEKAEEKPKNTENASISSETLRNVSEEKKKEKSDKRNKENISLLTVKDAFRKEDNIVNYPLSPISPSPHDEEYGLKAFMSDHEQIEVDGYNGMITEINYRILSKAISESDFLKKVTSFSWLCNHYRKIASGYYKNLSAKNVEKDWMSALKEI